MPFSLSDGKKSQNLENYGISDFTLINKLQYGHMLSPNESLISETLFCIIILTLVWKNLLYS